MTTIPVQYQDIKTTFIENKGKLIFLLVFIFFIDAFMLHFSGLTTSDTIEGIANKTIISSITVYLQLIAGISVVTSIVRTKLKESNLKIGVFKFVMSLISSVFMWMVFVLFFIGCVFQLIGDDAIVSFLTEATSAEREMDAERLIYSLAIVGSMAMCIYLSSVFVLVFIQQAVINFFCDKGKLLSSLKVHWAKMPFYSIVNIHKQWRALIVVFVILALKVTIGYLNISGYPLVGLFFNALTVIAFALVVSSSAYIGVTKVNVEHSELEL